MLTGKRLGALGAGAAAVAFTGVLATAPTASAEPDPADGGMDCFCACSSAHQTGRIVRH
ncbi:hypothetical protein OHB14_11820 [Streptomyces sp. NBC_01613]|uniref:hypothetical protein n=1 Tax=Streptomyces sp. NBC_01613 TaxID=2975896 RepID=UPI003868A272